ncbi:MAG: hypothetical protein A2Y33_12245 [Spirochaetes bacterium GWF1_51_8]|nr:MAG: hypothetical protein A2Y33_12245 [Spirochaetes bacterium GWF1_51_8]
MKYYFFALLFLISLSACGDVSDLSILQGQWYVSHVEFTNGTSTNYGITNTIAKYTFGAREVISYNYGFTTNITTNDFLIREGLSRISLDMNGTNVYIFYTFTGTTNMKWTLMTNIKSGAVKVGGKSQYTYWILNWAGN